MAGRLCSTRERRQSNVIGRLTLCCVLACSRKDASRARSRRCPAVMEGNKNDEVERGHSTSPVRQRRHLTEKNKTSTRRLCSVHVDDAALCTCKRNRASTPSVVTFCVPERQLRVGRVKLRLNATSAGRLSLSSTPRRWSWLFCCCFFRKTRSSFLLSDRVVRRLADKRRDPLFSFLPIQVLRLRLVVPETCVAGSATRFWKGQDSEGRLVVTAVSLQEIEAS